MSVSTVVANQLIEVRLRLPAVVVRYLSDRRSFCMVDSLRQPRREATS
jgi:hypothetical protein